jgi:hypothetical protein
MHENSANAKKGEEQLFLHVVLHCSLLTASILQHYRYRGTSSCPTMAEAQLEQQLRPTTRYRDRLQLARPGHTLPPSDFTEVQLPFCPSQEDDADISSSSLSSLLPVEWHDLHTLCQTTPHSNTNKVVWVLNNAFLKSTASYNDDLVHPRRVCLAAQYSGQKLTVFAETAETAERVVGWLLAMAGTAVKPDLVLQRLGRDPLRPGSGAAWRSFLQHTAGRLRKLTLDGFVLTKQHCDALTMMTTTTTTERHEQHPVADVKLYKCVIGNEAADAFMNWMRSDSGPTVLFRCDFANNSNNDSPERNSNALADALVTCRRLKKLVLAGDSVDDWAAFHHGLARNTSLIKLYLGRQVVGSSDWNHMCQALQSHPSLQVLDVAGARELGRVGRGQGGADVSMAERRRRRTTAVAAMLDQNTVLHTVEMADSARDLALYHERIGPRLEMNLYWPRVMALQQSHGRLPVLGHALGRVRHCPNRTWMILSGNIDILTLAKEDQRGGVGVVKDDKMR